MFESIRTHKKVLMGILVLLIIPSFVLFGVEGYTRMQQQGTPVARVDGQDITQEEWDRAHRAEVDRLRASMPSLDPKLLDSAEARYLTLERLVRDRVLAAVSRDSHLVVTNERLTRELRRDPSIQQFRGPDGKLDTEAYQRALSYQGLTPAAFEARVRADIERRQALLGVAGTAVAPGALADLALNAFFEKREVQIARFATVDFRAQVRVSDDDVRAFYQANPQLFQAPEEADIEYLVLDLDAVRDKVTVSEPEMREYFAQHAERLAAQEERRASHILITAPASAPADARERAKARAQELLAEVRKNPAAFADLARRHSQDPGSAANGGDLDFFARSAMVKPFADAVFSMKKGDISDVVETEFGYHIIRLTDIKVPRQRSFDEMRPEIEAELRKQAAQRKFAESAESFTNLVFEQSDSLKPAAERLGLTVRSAQNVPRQPAEGARGILANKRLLEALFSRDAIEGKRNTEAVETATSQLVSARIVAHRPARTMPFEEVQAGARNRLIVQRAAELARQEGEKKLREWTAAPDGARLPPALTLSRDEPGDWPRSVVEAVLRVDADKLPAFTGADLGTDGYAVIRVNKVLPRSALNPQERNEERNEYRQRWAAAESLAYYETLKDRYKVRILVSKPTREPR